MEEKLTLEKLKAMQPGEIFAQGTVKNSPDGIYMTSIDKGRSLLWVAKRGGIHDWAIYVHWESSGLQYVIEQGDKIFDESNIKKLVPCDDEALSMYRH